MLNQNNSYEQKKFKTEQRQAYRYTNDSFPCLVGHFNAHPEDLPSKEDNPIDYYRINARNGLRHLTYGTPLFKGSLLKPSNLKLAWLNFEALFLKRDKQLLNALRAEMKVMLQNAYTISRHCDPKAEQRLEILVNTLLSNFPFMDPEENEEVHIPQKIKGQWRAVSYRFTKKNISPQSGWFSKIIEDEDNIYAYCLEPDDQEASPFLLLMGTTYPSGQGAGFALLGDLTDGQSVGERHDLTELDQWIRTHQNIKVTGHSQGGTMALIVAARYPDHILQAYSLNPAALLSSTIKKLLPLWNKPRSRNPELLVFTQKDDPVFIFGDQFLPGTKLILVDHPESQKSSILAAHAHHYSGYQSASYHQLDSLKLEGHANKRRFMNDLKQVADKVVGPLLSLSMTYFILRRKMLRYFSRHQQRLRTFLFFALLATAAILLTSSFMGTALLALPLFQSLSPGLTIAALTLGSIVASAVTAYVLPIVTHLAVNVIQFAVGVAASCVIGITLGLSSLVAGFKALVNAFMRPAAIPEKQHGSTGQVFTSLGCCRQDLVLEEKLNIENNHEGSSPLNTPAQQLDKIRDHLLDPHLSLSSESNMASDSKDRPSMCSP